MNNKNKKPIRWLTFDVLGTCVDWRSSLSEEGAKEWKSLGLQPTVDWRSFAVTWVDHYAMGIQAANAPGSWLPACIVIRNGLEEALTSCGVSTVSESDKDALCSLWDRLRPWPNAVHGIEKIRKSGRSVATLSNFGADILKAISNHGGMKWDRILSSEMAKSYKPNPAVYKMAVEELNEEPAKIMMVAAHSYDLSAAAKIGFATAFVIRAGEDPPPAPHEFDLVVPDFDDLATQLTEKFSLQ